MIERYDTIGDPGDPQVEHHVLQLADPLAFRIHDFGAEQLMCAHNAHPHELARRVLHK
jgi:hypothetical protein